MALLYLLIFLIFLVISPIWISLSLFPFQVRVDLVFFGISFEKSDTIKSENKTQKKKNFSKKKLKKAVTFLCRNSTISIRHGIIPTVLENWRGASIGIGYAILGCLLAFPYLFFENVEPIEEGNTVLRIKTRVLFLILSFLLYKTGDEKNVGQPNE